ncbi:MAG: MBOAT family protein [Oscillospiraceae bacterium]|nr:MBOAT family protein [Oscillospiraceae bacterium]
MSYTSAGFLLFVAVTAAAYFLFPVKKYQWTVLLAASCFFYLYASLRGAAYILLTTLTTWGGTLMLDRIIRTTGDTLREKKGEWDRETRKRYKRTRERKKRLAAAGILLVNFGVLAFVKYYNFGVESLGSLLGAELSRYTLRLLLPLGISFYTFQSMGYVIDVYREKAEAEQNLGRVALFVSFFPQIVQGPVSAWSDLAHQLWEPHSFDFTRFKYGCELILWGFFKKLVIADRAVTAVSAVMGNGEILSLYNGTTLTFSLLLYALQLYADFSGGIDISRGVAQMLGIDLTQNFRQPFFASSVSDFWRRWHISLGAWMKNYLFYPLALSDGALRTTLKLQKTRFGRSAAGAHIAKVLPSCFASVVVFLVVGIWHGAEWKCVAYGLYNGVIIAAATLLEPVFKWQNRKLHIDPASAPMRLFRILRTFALTLLGFVADLTPGVRTIPGIVKKLLLDQHPGAAWIEIRDGLGLLKVDYIMLAAGAAVLFVVGVVRERHPDTPLRSLLEERPWPVRGGLILLCAAAVIVFGVYGWKYNAMDFVYMQF